MIIDSTGRIWPLLINVFAASAAGFNRRSVQIHTFWPIRKQIERTSSDRAAQRKIYKSFNQHCFWTQNKLVWRASHDELSMSKQRQERHDIVERGERMRGQVENWNKIPVEMQQKSITGVGQKLQIIHRRCAGKKVVKGLLYDFLVMKVAKYVGPYWQLLYVDITSSTVMCWERGPCTYSQFWDAALRTFSQTRVVPVLQANGARPYHCFCKA